MKRNEMTILSPRSGRAASGAVPDGCGTERTIAQMQEFSGAACALRPGASEGRRCPGERCAGRDRGVGIAGANARKSSHHSDTPEHLWR